MLLTLSYIKQNFPQWDHYAAYDLSVPPDETLTNQLTNAEAEFAQYVTADEATITGPLKLHLLNIVRKNLFELQHADTEFERDPAIISDYKQTIEQLIALRSGKRPAEPAKPGSGQGTLKITAKNRRFDRWFRETGSYKVKSTDENQP